MSRSDPEKDNTLYQAMEEFKIIQNGCEFTASDIAVFYSLLYIWNSARRPKIIKRWARRLCLDSGLTDKPLRTARKTLIESGVIFYLKNGNRGEPHYSLEALFGKPNPFTKNLQADMTSKEAVSGQLIASKEAVSGQSKQEKEKEEGKNKKRTAFQPPEYEEFESYLLEQMPKVNPEWTTERITRAAKLQFETYEESDPKPNVWRDGNGSLVKSWKSKAKNSICYKKPWQFGGDSNQSANQTSQPQTIKYL